MHQAIEAIEPNLLYRIGCTVEPENLSWLPPGSAGEEPLNCYVVLDENEALFIDTGAAVAAPAVELAIAERIGKRDITVFLTRNAEGECIGNLRRVLASRDNAKLLFGGGGGILEWLTDPADLTDQSGALGSHVKLSPARNGMSYELPSGSLVHWLDAPVKQMKLTQWAYHEKTKSLFTSDFFTWQRSEDGKGSALSPCPRPDGNVERIANEIAARMHWIPGARCEQLTPGLKQVFERYEVETIAPSYGCVVRGREAVDENLQAAIDALALLLSTTDS